MKTISIYARSGDSAPAGYYRIFQYLYRIKDIDYKIRPLLSDEQFLWFMKHHSNNIIIKLFLYTIQFLLIIFRVTCFLLLDIKRQPDYIIVSRCFVPHKTPYFILYLVKKTLRNSKLIWDFDDHILNSHQITQKMFDFLCKRSERIVVIHDFLKNLIPNEYQYKVVLLPTTDGDMKYAIKNENILKNRSILYKEEIRLIWVATSSNLPSLEMILPTLDIAAKKIIDKLHKKLILSIICNQFLDETYSNLEIRKIKWSHNIAIKEMENSHIGIMPLIDNEFSKGKGGFKLIQYISIGLPVIGSNVGFNNQIIDESMGKLISNDTNMSENWINSILFYASNWDEYINASKMAYNKWNNNFSFDNNLKVWKKILNVN